MDELSVTTVEGVGSEKMGLSSVQQALVRHHGTQCGFCTPGFVSSPLYIFLIHEQSIDRYIGSIVVSGKNVSKCSWIVKNLRIEPEREREK
jgi:xanthine dehydrogenase iron-sulfur cluster and FAD-binding subunit A